ncbi:DUF2254 domain-containing protein [Oculatella sp. LEGE 06141]|uniref:DUF2254 domain-containing protein n=1 Tax=Oculatella sp. LEGE 06141 TaxID=1828648 RepID=UPI0018821F0F|nr:DUF2254 domain-containing protein [Oculatella sp. LEGE 06141]MBE9182480.1 DUF2254 domain-containing protein [Oculatella sp. LEGE 06141]
MKNVKLSKLWDSLHTNYWFLPTLMAIGAVVLAFSMLFIDWRTKDAMDNLPWIYSGGPDGARGLLSTVAGSMITVAATAFSITVVALQLAASNFGPRLLRNFMQDTGNQIVLGTFIGTFIYCLLILRTVRGEDYTLFVPQLSVTVGMLLAIASIGVLIYFINHASTIIQASQIISGVAGELDDAIDRMFPEELGQDKSDEQLHTPGEIPNDFDRHVSPIASTQTGYLQIVDEQLLLKVACQCSLLLRLESRPGEFVLQGNPLVMVYPQERINQKLIDRINRAFVLGRERTEQQDVEFPINQLVEIALRALSPGINDPFTAIRCIDRLCAGLSHLAERPFPSAYRYDEDRALRIIAVPVTFEQLVNTAFNQIRHYGQSDVVVTMHLLTAIAQIASRTHRSHDRFALQQQAEMIFQGSREGLSQKYDQQMVEDRYRQVIATLGV